MIVRIATEGQYRVDEGQSARLQELDAAVVAAAEADDADGFARAYAQLLDFVRTGEALADGDLAASDAILAPPGTALHEAVAEWKLDDLIPS